MSKPFVAKENAGITLLEDGKSETRSRVKFLAKLNKSSTSSKNSANTELREVVWRIQKSYFEWKPWRHEVAVVLNEEGYAEVAMTLIKQVIKAFNPKDEGLYKLSRNLFGSVANYSDYLPFGTNLAKHGAVESMITHLTNELQTMELSQNDPALSNNFLTKCSLQLLMNLLKTGESVDDFVKYDAASIFKTLIAGSDEEVKCLAALCHLNLLNVWNSSSDVQSNYVDERNVGEVFLKAISAWLDRGGDDRHKDVRVSIEAIEALIEGLSQLSGLESNKAKLIKAGAFQVLQRLLELDSYEPICIRCVNLTTALFSYPSQEELQHISDEEANQILGRLRAISSTANESHEQDNVRKAIQATNDFLVSKSASPKPLVVVTEVDKDDDASDNELLPAQKSESEEGQLMFATPEIVRTNRPPAEEPGKEAWREELGDVVFKENEILKTSEEAVAEMQLRVKFLDKLLKLAPTNFIMDESRWALQLLSTIHWAWPDWQNEIAEAITTRENFQGILLPYCRSLTDEFLQENDQSLASLLANFYSYISNVVECCPHLKKDEDIKDLMVFLLNFLDDVRDAESQSAADGVIAEVINLLNILSQSDSLGPTLQKHEAEKVLTNYSESPVHGLAANKVISRVTSQSQGDSKENNAQQDRSESTQPAVTPSTSQTNAEVPPDLKKWTKKDVQTWLADVGLESTFATGMAEFDGERLWMLLQIEKKAPEHYFNSVSKHFKAELPDMLQLYAALTQLSESHC